VGVGPVASVAVSDSPPPPDRSGDGTSAEGANAERSIAERRAAATDALHAAFNRLRPQGSDAWNFLAAFTHLGDRYGPYSPGASDLSREMEAAADPGSAGRPGSWKQRIAQKAGLAGAGPQAAGGGVGGVGGGAAGDHTELEQAMAQVVEAFRFLSARVRTLEERLALEDRPVDGAAWLVPAQELGHWVEPVAAHIVAASTGGDVLHADSGEGQLLAALEKAGLVACGVEPRGAVALGALERGRTVTLAEGSEALATRPASSLGGLVLSGVVDRLPLHALVSLLARARIVLEAGAPLIIVASDPEQQGTWSQDVAQDLLHPRPLHAQTWELLLQRAGFVAVTPLGGRVDDRDTRFALSAVAPA
jgi:hypothetical protein